MPRRVNSARKRVAWAMLLLSSIGCANQPGRAWRKPDHQAQLNTSASTKAAELVTVDPTVQISESSDGPKILLASLQQPVVESKEQRALRLRATR